MILFWLLVAFMIAIALALVVPPLLGTIRSRTNRSVDDANVSLAQQRAQELEAELQKGTLSTDQFQQSKQELARDLLDDLKHRESESSEPGSAQRSPWTALAILVIVPLLSLGMYQMFGSSEPIATLAAGTTQPEPSDPETAPDVASIEALVDQLAARLEQEPEDVQGWQLLGLTYMRLGRFSEAREAYGKARALAGDEAELLAAYAEASARAAGDNLQGEPTELLERALELQPGNQKALWLSALAAMQRNAIDAALVHLENLRELQPDGSDNRQRIDEVIGDLRARAGPESMVSTDTAASSPASDTAGDAPGNEQAAGIEVSVSLDESLTRSLSGNETLFVYARALNGAPMPVALVRKQASDLPLSVRLDDSTAMLPEMKLSNFSAVEVIARVS